MGKYTFKSYSDSLSMLAYTDFVDYSGPDIAEELPAMASALPS